MKLNKNLELREALAEIDKLTSKIVNLKSELETSMEKAEKGLYYAMLLLEKEDDYDERDILHELNSKNRNEIKIYKNLLELIK